MAVPRWMGLPRKHWFDDARDDGRQMELAWHPEQRLVVISLWNGSTCRATFQLPIEVAPAVISALAASLGEAAASATAPPVRPPPPLLERGRALLQRGRARLQREPAQILSLTRHRPH